MGLDWNPGNKPKQGYETEFRELVIALAGDKLGSRVRPGFINSLRHNFLRSFRFRSSNAELLRRYNEISISAFETLDAPRVGFDTRADEWAREMHVKRKITAPLDDYLNKLHGYYVVPLVERCDGIPFYSNGIVASYVERFSFRAQFLNSCASVIGHELLQEAYILKFAPDLLVYARRLRSAADGFARSNSIVIPKDAPADPDTTESHLCVVDAAARWCQFWAERGHLPDPYF
ncbi:MAG: hypothetical protein ABSE22_20900 [Xanthobacteraceae bacterium]|jgi:hypothetical protein